MNKKHIYKCSKCGQDFYLEEKVNIHFYRIDLTPIITSTEWPKVTEKCRYQYHGYICLDCLISIFKNMNLIPDCVNNKEEQNESENDN